MSIANQLRRLLALAGRISFRASFLPLCIALNACGGGGSSVSAPITGGGDTPQAGSGGSPISAPSDLALTSSLNGKAIGLNGSVTLSVTATSDVTPTYQWRRNTVAIPGATQANYNFFTKADDHYANFDVIVSNSGGSIISNAVQPSVIVLPLPADTLPTCHKTNALAQTGTAVPALAGLDALIRNYMQARGTPAATVVVRNQGVVIYERGFGWQDITCTRPMPYDGLFRSGSLAKPITATAVRLLIAEGRLALSDKIFCLPNSATNCVLNFTSVTPLDSRTKDITIDHLLNHTSGWDQQQFQDPTFASLEVSDILSITTPPSKSQVAQYMLQNQVLQNAPGSTTAYSNVGYALLGLAIEARAGQNYLSYVQNKMLTPLGISSADMLGARSMPENRDTREPWYSDPRQYAVYSVFGTGSLLKHPDAGVPYEQMDSYVGWIFSGRNYSRFMNTYGLEGLTARNTAGWYYYTGSMPGTFNFALQHGSIDVVYLSNQRRQDINLQDSLSQPDDISLRDEILNWIGTMQSWPSQAPNGHAP